MGSRVPPLVTFCRGHCRRSTISTHSGSYILSVGRSEGDTDWKGKVIPKFVGSDALS